MVNLKFLKKKKIVKIGTQNFINSQSGFVRTIINWKENSGQALKRLAAICRRS